MALPENYRQRVIEELKKRKATGLCEICKHNDWIILEQAASLTVDDLSRAWTLPPSRVPCVAVACKNCGHVRLHSLGVLGLLPREEAADQKGGMTE